MTGQTLLPRTVMWRRIDCEGMDACSYDATDNGYIIVGTAIFLEGLEPAKFEYKVSCNSDWSSQTAWVDGWVGSTRRQLSVSRDPAGNWILDGAVVDGATGLLDIDFGFTPATNTNAIRRLRLGIGEETETTALRLDTNDWCFKPLRQVFRRLSENELGYNSPSHSYSATLLSDEFGIIREYPQLWTAVSKPDVHGA